MMPLSDKPLMSPQVFMHICHRLDLLDEFYEAMSKPDLCEVGMYALKILNMAKTTSIMDLNIFAPETETLPKCIKSEEKSTEVRNKGNRHYAKGMHRKALTFYNKALLHAPYGSQAMVLAYSNRSALFLKVKAYSACLKDIDTCFSMNCPESITEKLRKRQKEATENVWMELLAEEHNKTPFDERFFHIKRHNSEITTASSDIEVVIENDVPKLVAATDIKVGTVLAVERAFVSMSNPTMAMFSCYYCHKMELNLKPCNGCIVALFCDDKCRKKCLKEYHNVECQLIEYMETFTWGSTARLSLQAVIKMKSLSEWNELIEASKNLGPSRLKTSTNREIFDNKFKYSLLNKESERHFFHGPLYNAGIRSAYIMYYLNKVPGFYPTSPEEKSEAERAVARLLVFLCLYSTNNQLVPCVTIQEQNNNIPFTFPNNGWYSLLGKVRNACEANILGVSLNKKAGLVALRPIQKGTELTISTADIWPDIHEGTRQRRMYVTSGVVCDCAYCFPGKRDTKCELTPNVQRLLNEVEEILKSTACPEDVQKIFMKCSRILTELKDYPFSEEYNFAHTVFRRCVTHFQDIATRNVLLHGSG